MIISGVATCEPPSQNRMDAFYQSFYIRFYTKSDMILYCFLFAVGLIADINIRRGRGPSTLVVSCLVWFSIFGLAIDKKTVVV